METTTARTYELFDISWDRGSRWTGYDTQAEAQLVLDHASLRGQYGRIERRTWTVDIPAGREHLYRPGVS